MIELKYASARRRVLLRPQSRAAASPGLDQRNSELLKVDPRPGSTAKQTTFRLSGDAD